MKTIKFILLIAVILNGFITVAQDFSIKSPDDNIVINISNSKKLTYSVTIKGQSIINQSPMGFEFKDEEPMTGNFIVTDQKSNNVNEKWTPQINIPEIIEYAQSKNVKIILWLYSSDVNRNAAYKQAFPIYQKWGVSGIKIDFMDRDDQQMVNWYHDIIKCAAENHLLVDFHGAYKPDGIIRTYPNMITREDVMGNEYYKFSDKMSPEHNVKLAFTRVLAGQMDYTPGGFLNVTKEKFRQQTPAIVWITRAAELLKFVIYESPLTVVCDHPDNILNKAGSDFLKIVPTVWDDIKFVGGYPGEYVAIAKRSGKIWFLGVMNNSIGKSVDISLDFLPAGNYAMEMWTDSKKSDKEPMDLKKSEKQVNSVDTIKVTMAKNGGYVALIKSK